MLDFLLISTKSPKRDVVEIYPKFIIKKSSDLMIRGGDFYAIWIKEKGLWSTDEQDALSLIDAELDAYYEAHKDEFDCKVKVQHMWDSDTNMIDKWHKYCQKQMRDEYHMLDEKLIFSNIETKKRDYASRKLEYPLEPCETPAYEKLISTLYEPEERHKIEWSIGSIISGESKKIQKFVVLYGAAGTGKSTILNIIQQLFDGYYSTFDAKALGSSNNSFALEAFKTNPLVAIQHDGDLSKIEDNTRLNSLVSHELMTVNEKFKSTYSSRFKCFLFMGTNKPVKITDGRSGLIRRLIDVSPSGEKLNIREYKQAVKQVSFELGGIAQHCLEVYMADPGYYDDYIPIAMLGASNDFYNYIIDSYHIFKKDDGTSLTAAWAMYKEYCLEANVAYPFSQRVFKEELKNYFKEYKDRFSLDDGSRVRSYYKGFRTDKFEAERLGGSADNIETLKLNCKNSIFDKECANCPAQYATSKETPSKKWDNCKTVLADIDTHEVHFVKVPENHIVIDFDLKNEQGEKDLNKNIEEASKWPPTYAEVSKSGSGIHLHYIYTGDVEKLSRIFDDHIEIKVFTGKSSLRRKLTKCNNNPIAILNSGLPLKKGGDKVVNASTIQSEKGLRTLIKKNLNKEIHPATKPSMDFIKKILDDAYDSGLSYDVSDMRNEILAFAAQSSNNSDYCIKLIRDLKFCSENRSEAVSAAKSEIVFYDVEVFPNLFLINWKKKGPHKQVHRLINPSSKDVEMLMEYSLIGFNCRRYDNHILYGRLMGYTNQQLYNLSRHIIDNDKEALFGEAYNISYTDVYDFSADKKSLKKWEIELGIHHQELGLPWDEPVPEEKWDEVAEYCDNDVLATEAVFNHLKGDWTAREILADVANATVNDTTNSLTTKIIFGNDRHPQDLFNYRDMSELNDTDVFMEIGDSMNEFTRFDLFGRPVFPGYEYKNGVSTYRNEKVGEGGYVYSCKGMWGNVALLDVASMHPSSIIAEDLFGPYTKRFQEIRDARVAIKHGDFEKAKTMLDGKLAKYLDDPSTAKDLAQALKIAINSVYGLTAAGFPNAFKDNRNKDNIVAKRGALFMINLKHEVARKGYTVVHIKTDSIKIADADQSIIDFVMEYGKHYGYTFEHEATYEKMCLVNDAVYIAKYDNGKWTATGTQFQVPYVFKSLFSKEDIEFKDLCETKAVTTALYLDYNEELPSGEHDYHFVGKIGNFCPIKPHCGGGELLRAGTDKDGNIKYSSATDCKGYRWLESEFVKKAKSEKNIDRDYYNEKVDKAVAEISQWGDFEWFVSDSPYEGSMLQAMNLVPF